MATKFPKLKPKIKKLWVDALRSGKFEQGQGRLKSHSNQFCCLGVLCEVHRKVTKKKGWDVDSDNTYNHERYDLPEVVAKWAFENPDDARDENGYDPRLSKNSLATQANDDKNMSFKQIANLIEKNL